MFKYELIFKIKMNYIVQQYYYNNNKQIIKYLQEKCYITQNKNSQLWSWMEIHKETFFKKRTKTYFNTIEYIKLLYTA